MTRRLIPVDEFTAPIHKLWSDQWFLLTCGDHTAAHFNAMTVAWGSMGIMWGKPFVQVVVRPVRYTYEFMERYDSFTVNAFAPEYKRALLKLGSTSGRDGDKIALSGLTPVASSLVAAPSFAEAELTIECRKIYWQDFDPTHFLDPSIESNYAQKDYHRAYFGEVLAIWGVPGKWAQPTGG
ncbi:MAG: flavin reductase family protein [Anaerolineales bacterium]|nr:flavin reductase family protein [Anaerolineales bacterium]